MATATMDRKPTRPRPLSADSTPRPSSPSILLTMAELVVPSAIQSGLARFSLTRRSSSLQRVDYQCQQKNSASAPPSGARTPVTGVDNTIMLSSAQLEESLYFREEFRQEQASTARRSSNYDRRHYVEDQSGISWKFASTGLSHLSRAVDEFSTASQDPGSVDSNYVRQMYVDGLAYLLRGLPQDMTAEEQMRVRNAMPISVVRPLYPSSSSSALDFSSPPSEPSILHRWLAFLIVQGFLIFQFLLPFITKWITTVYQYEREHKISQKIIGQGLDSMDIVGKKGIGLVNIICGMGDGKVGHILMKVASYVAEGLTGGIHEGIGQGMAIMGVGKTDLVVERQ
ncbi:hypothetical protein B0O99DRAFT_617954 [Bisporella sp. PMI_857]|nr:hypothetical protein B0O99DRAFT_617954 [Bisporella sp. PMI_857]